RVAPRACQGGSGAAVRQVGDDGAAPTAMISTRWFRTCRPSRSRPWKEAQQRIEQVVLAVQVDVVAGVGDGCQPGADIPGQHRARVTLRQSSTLAADDQD